MPINTSVERTGRLVPVVRGQTKVRFIVTRKSKKR